MIPQTGAELANRLRADHFRRLRIIARHRRLRARRLALARRWW